MKLKDGRITMLFNDNGLTIELHDKTATIQFAQVVLTPKQVMQALSRLAYTECSIEIFQLERIGLKMEIDKFEFELHIPSDDFVTRQTEEELAKKLARKRCPKGWEPDLYFNSKGSFFNKDGRRWARTTIRRWV